MHLRRREWVLIVIAALLWCPLSVYARQAAGQARPQEYRPLSNGEMVEQGLWDTWIRTFGALSAKQQAEVVRRHVDLCLRFLPDITDEQRVLIRALTAKYVTEEAYALASPGADLGKRVAFQEAMHADMEAARHVLGNELSYAVFSAKPPLSVLEAVLKDPAFRK